MSNTSLCASTSTCNPTRKSPSGSSAGSHLAEQGWYSGDSHIHLHTGGPIKVEIADALLAARAEDLNYSNLCVSNNVGDDIRDAELITGKPHALSDERHLLVFGEEMRSSIYGHMQFFGIKKLVEPQYTGFDNTPLSNDYPPNFDQAEEAVRQGGVVTYGHPIFTNQPDPFAVDPLVHNAAARELPIDAILGKAHAIDLMCYGSDEDLSAQLWYRLLNCGLRLAASVGTDALLDHPTLPLGGERVYVKVDGKFTMESWLDGLKAGRSFVTNGPVLALRVNGQGIGETVRLDAPGKVRVEAEVQSAFPLSALELIVGGNDRAQRTLPRKTRRGRHRHQAIGRGHCDGAIRLGGLAGSRSGEPARPRRPGLGARQSRLRHRRWQTDRQQERRRLLRRMDRPPHRLDGPTQSLRQTRRPPTRRSPLPPRPNPLSRNRHRRPLRGGDAR